MVIVVVQLCARRPPNHPTRAIHLDLRSRVVDVAEFLHIDVDHRPGSLMVTAAEHFPGTFLHEQQAVQPAPDQNEAGVPSFADRGRPQPLLSVQTNELAHRLPPGASVRTCWPCRPHPSQLSGPPAVWQLARSS